MSFARRSKLLKMEATKISKRLTGESVLADEEGLGVRLTVLVPPQGPRVTLV